LINCYKILEVPDYSGAKVIRKSYIRLAKKHHPDVAKNSNGEHFKVISKAYDTLTDPSTKRFHDQKLKYGQETKRVSPGHWDHPYGQRTQKPRPNVDFAQRKARAVQMKLKQDLAYYAKQNEQLPYKYRVIGWSVFSFVGWQIVYQNWFVNEEGYDHILTFIGFILFVVGSIGVLSILYKLYRYQNYTTNKKVRFYRKSTTTWAVFLLIGATLLPVLNSIRKSYHLSHYGRYDLVDFSRRVGSESVKIHFTPNNDGRQVVKYVILTEKNIYDWDNKWVLVKYSKANPRILEVVEKDNYPFPDPTK